MHFLFWNTFFSFQRYCIFLYYANKESDGIICCPSKTVINPFTPKSDLIDFTLSNARRFYSSKGDPLGEKGLKDYLP